MNRWIWRASVAAMGGSLLGNPFTPNGISASTQPSVTSPYVANLVSPVGVGAFPGARPTIGIVSDGVILNVDNASFPLLTTKITASADQKFVALDLNPDLNSFGGFVAFDADITAPAAANDPAQAAVDKALAYLKTQQQPDFSWQAHDYEPIGFTALVLKAYVSAGYDPDLPYLDKSFDKLLAAQQPNGGIYKDSEACYNTAIAVSALATSGETEYKPAIAKALVYLRTVQWSDDIQGIPKEMQVSNKDSRFGGFGYGKKSRSDLSNTQFALDALHDAGVKSDDPAFQEAVKFASRCQNSSETNDQGWASNDGGFVYTPAGDGMSPAGEYTGPNGKRMLRSYGSMTYAGFKSMIYAGLAHDDPRVKAAWDWISKNYSVDANPGMPADDAQGGLYYYYYTMARALAAYGEPIITDAQGNKHDWRAELIHKIISLQKPDGSFSGERKWMEDNSVLCTAYVVQTLEEAMKDIKNHPAK